MIIGRTCKIDAPARVSAAGAFPVVTEGMKRGLTALLILAWTILMCLDAAPVTAEAVYADDTYTTPEFDVNVDITANHIMQYDEQIVVNFLEPHHGIYRYIPIQKKFYDISGIMVDGGQFEDDYSYSGENEYGTYGNEVLKIGDPYQTYTGEKEYRVRYNLECTKDEDDDYDWLSLDLIPTGWQNPIDNATAYLTLPEKVDWGTFRLYTGLAGEEIDVLEDSRFTVEFGDDYKTMKVVAHDLPQGYGVTVQATLPEGYWKGVTSRRWMGFFALLIPSMLALLMALLWVLNGKDPAVVKPVEFYPPDDITPAEVGYIVDGTIDNKDLSSMIIYFASKGYLEIREKANGSKKYELVKKRDIPDSEPVFAVRLFGGLFPVNKAVEGKEQKVDLDHLPKDFGSAVRVARDELEGMYDNGRRKMFTDGSRNARNWGAFICSLILPFPILITNFVNYRGFGLFTAAIPFILVLIGTALISSSYDRRHSSARVESVGKFIGGLALAVVASLVTVGSCAAAVGKADIVYGLIVGAVTTASLAAGIFFQVFMWARTKENVVIYGKILGFRNFIETAEHDRLVALSDENPEYYYSIMPYAMVMGMSVAWAKKFENMKIPQPDWYEGAEVMDLSRAVWYSNIANSCSRQFVDASAMIPDVASAVDSGGFFTGGGGSMSGGGFGGGGFSGGGFGGGGGGAW